MAKKGTYGALAGQEKLVDFGATTAKMGEDVLKTVLVGRERQQREKRYAEALRMQNYNDIVAMDKAAQKGLEFDLSGPLSNLAGLNSKLSAEQYADIRREYDKASYADRPGLLVKMNRYLNNNKNLNEAYKGINNLLTTYNAYVGKKGGFSAYGSAPHIRAITEALNSVAEGKITNLGEGTYALGDRVTVEKVGTPDMRLKIKNYKGELVANNTLQNITATLTKGFKPFQDIPGFIDDISKRTSLVYKKDAVPSDFDLGFTTQVDEAGTLKGIKSLINDDISDDMLDEMIVMGRFGDTREEIVDHIARRVYNSHKGAYDAKAKNTTSAKEIDKAMKLGARRSRLEATARMAPGTTKRMEGFIFNTKKGPGRIKEVKRIGSDYIIDAVVGKGDDADTVSTTFDFNNPQSIYNFYDKLNMTISKTDTEDNVLSRNIMPLMNFDPRKNVPVENSENYYRNYGTYAGKLMKDKIAEGEELTNAFLSEQAEKINGEIGAKGYRFDIDEDWYWHANNDVYRVFITTPEGEEKSIFFLKYKGVDGIAEFLDRAVDDIKNNRIIKLEGYGVSDKAEGKEIKVKKQPGEEKTQPGDTTKTITPAVDTTTLLGKVQAQLGAQSIDNQENTARDTTDQGLGTQPGQPPAPPPPPRDPDTDLEEALREKKERNANPDTVKVGEGRVPIDPENLETVPSEPIKPKVLSKNNKQNKKEVIPTLTERQLEAWDKSHKGTDVESFRGYILDDIARKESFRSTAYHDSDDKETGEPRYSIGFGQQTINGRAVQPGDTITREEATKQFYKQFNGYFAPITHLKPYINLSFDGLQGMFDYSYNLGAGRLMDLVKLINDGESYAALKKHIMQFAGRWQDGEMQHPKDLYLRRKDNWENIKKALKKTGYRPRKLPIGSTLIPPRLKRRKSPEPSEEI